MIGHPLPLYLLLIVERFPVRDYLLFEKNGSKLSGLLVLGGTHLLEKGRNAGRLPRVRLQNSFRFLDLFSVDESVFSSTNRVKNHAKTVPWFTSPLPRSEKYPVKYQKLKFFMFSQNEANQNIENRSRFEWSGERRHIRMGENLRKGERANNNRW